MSLFENKVTTLKIWLLMFATFSNLVLNSQLVKKVVDKPIKDINNLYKQIEVCFQMKNVASRESWNHN